jgi:hypothetical protein
LRYNLNDNQLPFTIHRGVGVLSKNIKVKVDCLFAVIELVHKLLG